MKMKRALLIGSLIVLFIVCYLEMNKHFDPLGRYKYADESNHDLILEYLNSDDINYLIDRQLEPEVFLPFLGIEGFSIRQAQTYYEVKEASMKPLWDIVYYVNTLADAGVDRSLIVELSDEYHLSMIEEFYSQMDEFAQGAQLMKSPSDYSQLIQENETLYRYEPLALAEVELPHVNAYFDHQDILLEEEVNQQLNELCSDLTRASGTTCGNLIVVGGYLSYYDQIELYEERLLEVGQDLLDQKAYLPGRMENQRGNIVELNLAKIQETDEGEADDEDKNRFDIFAWLNQHIGDYGFVWYQDKIDHNDKRIQLRYVNAENVDQNLGVKWEDLKWRS